MQAPERLAEKLIDRLQQGCLDAASQGHCSMVWDTPLPHSRSFSDMVARAFASKLKELRFSRFEWWNGKDWKEMPGRYVILHDTKYDKYTLRVRCHWPDDCEPEELEDIGEFEPSGGRDRRQTALTHEDSALMPVVEQLQQVLQLQQELIIQSTKAQVEAEERARATEARALAAEQSCLDTLEAMKDENVLLWQHMDEMKEAEKAIMKSITDELQDNLLRNLTPVGDA
jgi:hypothetical protein